MLGKDRYADIIDHSHWEPKNHPRMPMIKRAAQFKPFDALEGYSEACAESRRITDARIYLDEYEADFINMKLLEIEENLSSRPHVSLTYFEPDSRKDGGQYIEKEGRIRTIDHYERKLIFTDRSFVNIDDITSIDII